MSTDRSPHFVQKVLNVLTLFSMVGSERVSDPRPFVAATVNGKEMKALVDTGSEVTVIDSKSFMALNGSPVVQPIKCPLVGANGAKIEVLGKTNLTISATNCPSSLVEVLVVKHLGSKLILGSDFLGQHSVMVDVKRKILCEINSPGRASPNLTPVCSMEKKSVPPDHEASIRIDTHCPNTLFMFTSEKGFLPAVVKSDEQGYCKVVYQNGSILPRDVCRKEFVGYCRPIDETDLLKDISWKGSKNCFTLSKSTVDMQKEEVCRQVELNHLPNQLQKQYKDVLIEFPDIFSLNPNDIGHCKILPQKIILKDPNKITSIPPYRTAPNLQPVVKEYVHKLLDTGVIQRSTSPFCSPLLLVKKAGSKSNQPLVQQYRVVHDFRALNENTVRNSYPLHNLYDLIDKVAASNVWSVIDLSSGFWNQELEKPSRQYTAFAVPGMGHFEYTRSAQGLCNSPAAFQRLLDFITQDIEGVYVYIDDIVICSDDHEAHQVTLKRVFEKFRKYNLKCRPHKIQVATAEINYLGYNLSHEKGIRPGLAKTQAISNWHPPTTVKEIRQFLGLCSFFRRTIPHFSSIASPLTKLTRKDSAWKQGKLPSEAQQAFEVLKQKLTARPCLQPPDFTNRFYLTVDASGVGLGAVLSQFKNGTEHPVAFASRTLKESETKLAPFHLEYLGMVWAVRHFKPYLVGAQFTLRTDHKPLQSLNKTKSQVFDRFLLELSEYDYVVEYLKGSTMPADALSRKLEAISTPECIDLQKQLNLSWSQIKDLQKQDRKLKALVIYKLFNKLPSFPELREFVIDNEKRSVIHEGVLCRKIDDRLVVFASQGLQSSLLRMAHDSPAAGHYGEEKTLNRLMSYWTWPHMREDVKLYCQSCAECRKKNHFPNQQPAPLGSLPPAKSFNDRVHVDLLGMLPNQNGFKYALVIVDAYSKFLQIVPLPDKTMSVVTEGFYNEWITLFSVPKLVVSDLGKEFNNHLWKHLATQFGFTHQFSSPQHPQSNGQAESAVRTVLKYVRKYVDGNDWLSLIPNVRMSHNTAIHASIQATPFQAAFAMRPSLPGSIIYPETSPNYVASHLHRQVESFKSLRNDILKANKEATDRVEAQFNKRAKTRDFKLGDKVYVSRPHVGNQFQKFQPKSKGPYIVIEVTKNQNVVLSPYDPNLPKRKIKVHVNNVILAKGPLQFYDADSTQPSNKNAAEKSPGSAKPVVQNHIYDPGESYTVPAQQSHAPSASPPLSPASSASSFHSMHSARSASPAAAAAEPEFLQGPIASRTRSKV